MLVVNDVELIVEGVVAMLRPYGDQIRIVGTIAGELRPIHADVALVDAFGHPRAGLDRLRDVTSLGTCNHVALYTWQISTSMAVEIVKTGADGILSKAAPAQDIADALVRIAAGECVVHDFGDATLLHEGGDVADVALTERESELLVHVARGLSNYEIGHAMFLAESTVKTYLKRVYRKLGVHSRAQAVMRAVELGIARKDNVTDLRRSVDASD